MSNIVFNFDFLALVFSKILKSKFTLGGRTPPSGEFFFTQSEHFTISNCVLNFNILPLVVYEILGSPIFKLGGAVPLCIPPSGKFFCTQGEYVTMSKSVLTSTF